MGGGRGASACKTAAWDGYVRIKAFLRPSSSFFFVWSYLRSVCLIKEGEASLPAELSLGDDEWIDQSLRTSV